MASIKPTVEKDSGMINRSGVMTAPELSRELIDGTQRTEPNSEGGSETLAEHRADYIRRGETIGSLPAAQPQRGEKNGMTAMQVFLDRLGERLSFERGGARLYESMAQKAEVLGADQGVVDDLWHIQEEELQHFLMLAAAIEKLGGDPTVQTPSADVAGVISHGVFQVVADPRSSLPQCLQALLTAELVDRDGWQMLQEMAAALGEEDLAKKCESALNEETEHLTKVRAWLKALVQQEASAPPTRH